MYLIKAMKYNFYNIKSNLLQLLKESISTCCCFHFPHCGTASAPCDAQKLYFFHLPQLFSWLHLVSSMLPLASLIISPFWHHNVA